MRSMSGERGEVLPLSSARSQKGRISVNEEEEIDVSSLSRQFQRSPPRGIVYSVSQNSGTLSFRP